MAQTVIVQGIASGTKKLVLVVGVCHVLAQHSVNLTPMRPKKQLRKIVGQLSWGGGTYTGL